MPVESATAYGGVNLCQEFELHSTGPADREASGGGAETRTVGQVCQLLMVATGFRIISPNPDAMVAAGPIWRHDP